MPSSSLKTWEASADDRVVATCTTVHELYPRVYLLDDGLHVLKVCKTHGEQSVHNALHRACPEWVIPVLPPRHARPAGSKVWRPCKITPYHPPPRRRRRPVAPSPCSMVQVRAALQALVAAGHARHDPGEDWARPHNWLVDRGGAVRFHDFDKNVPRVGAHGK